MRNRIIKKCFYINYEEEKLLEEKCKKVGLSMSELIRCFINGFVPREKPGPEFYAEMKNFRMIGNNLNQLVKYSNMTGKVLQDTIRTRDVIEKAALEFAQKHLGKDKIEIVISVDNSRC